MNKEKKKKKDWMANLVGPLTPSPRLTEELATACGTNASPKLQRFAQTLKDKVVGRVDGSLNGSRAQIDALKSLLKRADMTGHLPNLEEEEQQQKVRRVLMRECLLTPGSTSLHRPILAALAHPDHERDAFHVYLATRLATEQWSGAQESVLPSLLDSLMAFPEHKAVIRLASLPILRALIAWVTDSLEASLTCLANGSAPGSVLTERISRSMASIHAVLGLDSDFLVLAGRCEMIVALASNLLLRGHWLPKETLSSCAATLYAALYASALDPAAVARQEASRIMKTNDMESDEKNGKEIRQPCPPYAHLPPLSKISCIRALLQSAPGPSALVDIVNAGMLSMTCDIIETTTDPVQKYHALHALTVGLERSGAYPLPIRIDREKIYSVLRRSWNDSQPSLMRMAHQALEFLLSASQVLQDHDAFVSSATSNVLGMPLRRKGRWGALSILIRQWSSVGLMPEDPDPLVRETLTAMTLNPAILTPAATTLGTLWSMVNWRADVWVTPLKERLAEGSAPSRKAICSYALPSLVSVSLSAQDRQRVVTLLLRLLEDGLVFNTLPLSSKLDLLATVRRFGFAELSETVEGRISYNLLRRGIRNTSLSLRTAALQLACFNARTTAPPSKSELSLVSEAISLSLRSTSSAERQTMCNSVQRMFLRLRACMKQNSEAHGALEEWTCQMLTGLTASLYPGAHYGRTLVAVNLIKAMLETFGTSIFALSQLQELNRSLFALLTDPWDKVREVACSCAILLSSECDSSSTNKPKNNNQSTQLLCDLKEEDSKLSIAWSLLWMPRLKDGDGGARRLLISAVTGDCLAVLDQLMNTLEERVCKDSAAVVEDLGKDGFVHGPLLALRYILPHVTLTASLRCRVLEVVSRVLEITMPPLSGPDMEEETDESFADHQDYEDDVMTEAHSQDHHSTPESCGRGHPSTQAVTCACWMSAKEAALVLGTMCRFGLGGWGVKEASALISVGFRLLRFLLEIKHNGALDKAQQGLEAVVTSFMEADPKGISMDVAFPDIPGRWLTEALTHLQRGGQGRRDIVRRSAGLPRAIHALLRAKPAGGARLIAMRGDCVETLLALAGGEVVPGVENESVKKDDGCWPRVHAFNVLRMVLGDADMADETNAYLSRGIIIAISAVESGSEESAGLSQSEKNMAMQGTQQVPWEVRNAATLLYTTLLVRILGFANVGQTSNYTNRGPSAAEFFANQKSLASFLVNKLESAASRLDAKHDAPPPFLFPILSLLARLKPSDESTEATESFVSPLLRCAGARNAAVRKGSALALASVAPFSCLSQVLSVDGTESPTTSKPGTENELHGRLLQVEAVLETRQQFANVDVDAVAKAASAYGPRSLCPTASPIVTSTYFRVILALLHRLKDMPGENICGQSVYRCIYEAIGWAWDLIVSFPNPETSWERDVVIGQDTMLREAVKLVLFPLPVRVQLALGNSKGIQNDTVEERLALCVQHPLSEVRAAAFESAETMLTMTMTMTMTGEGTGNDDDFDECHVAFLVASLASTYLITQSIEEKNENGMKEDRRVLATALMALTAALSALPPHRRAVSVRPQNDDEESFDIDILISSVIGMARGRCSDRLPAIQCLANLVGNDDAGGGGGKWLNAKIAIAVESSHAWQPSEFRMAAATLLSEGGLLSSVTFTKTEAGTKEGFVEAWALAFALLEDEDEGVRHKAASAVQGVLEKREKEELSEEALLRTAPGALVRLCFSEIGREEGEILRSREDKRLAAVVELMCHLIIPGDVLLAVGTVSHDINTDSNAALFDKEADNNHAEPLVIAQAAGTALVDLLVQHAARHGKQHRPSDEVDAAVWQTIWSWGLLVAEKVMSKLNGDLSRCSFVDMYRVLLVFWVCSHLPGHVDWLSRVLPQFMGPLCSSSSIGSSSSWLLQSLCRELCTGQSGQRGEMCDESLQGGAKVTFHPTTFLLDVVSCTNSDLMTDDDDDQVVDDFVEDSSPQHNRNTDSDYADWT